MGQGLLKGVGSDLRRARTFHRDLCAMLCCASLGRYFDLGG